MRTHHKVAAALTGLVVAALAVDTLVVLVTGERTFVTDDAGLGTLTSLAYDLFLGVTVLATACVVLRERDAFAAAPRLARWSRLPLACGLLGLACGFGVISPALRLAGVEEGPLATASDLTAGLVLGTAFVSAVTTGLGVLRRNPLGVGGRLLSLIIPASALTALLALVAPRAASPVLVTGVMLLGASLVGVRTTRQPATRAAIASPTTAV